MNLPVNQQPKEKQVVNPEGVLDVQNIWYTIQGEGPYAGTPAVFVRLAGCNLDCPGCDTDYTSQRKQYSPGMLLSKITQIYDHNPNSRFHPLLVLTGGEPFRQNFIPFVRTAIYSGFKVQIETNGTLYLEEMYPARMELICSPKTPKIDDRLKRYIRALKYVVKAGEIDPNDGLPTSVLDNGLRPARPWPEFNGEIYVQPMDQGFAINEGPNFNNLTAAIESCMKFGYRLSVQIHKAIGLE